MLDKAAVMAKVVEVVERIQEEGEFEKTGIDFGSCPVKDVPEFDSQLWIVAIIMIAEELEVTIPDNVNIFLTEDGTESLNIEAIAQKILDCSQKGDRK
jgi:hypothetical protein